MTQNQINDAPYGITPTELTRLMETSQTVVLDLVDIQSDFIHPYGALAVHPNFGCKEDASTLIEPLRAFAKAVPAGGADLVLAKFDTHFEDEYHRTPEYKIFPNPHCLYGTKGWNAVINLDILAAKFPGQTYFLAKNEFDMWGTNPVSVPRGEMTLTEKEERAYQNLFHFIPLEVDDDPQDRLADATPEELYPRTAFMDAQKVGAGTTVFLLGVASDVCDAFAIAGYLERGATVVVVEDLVKGIGASATAAPKTGNIREVITEHFASANPQALAEGRLRLARSNEVLPAMQHFARIRHAPAVL